MSHLRARNAVARWFNALQKAGPMQVRSSGDARPSPHVEVFDRSGASESDCHQPLPGFALGQADLVDDPPSQFCSRYCHRVHRSDWRPAIIATARESLCAVVTRHLGSCHYHDDPGT